MSFHSISSSEGASGSQVGSQNKRGAEYVDFTDKSIRHLKAASKRRVVWANGLDGLGLRISPKGTKSFVYKYDHEGQDRWITFGRYPKLKLTEALALYAEAHAKAQAGDDPAEKAVEANAADRKAITVRQLAEAYIEKHAKPKKRSWATDKCILNRDVVPRWGAKRASGITKRQVLDLLDDIVARDAPVMANRTLAVVRRMFNFALDQDYLAGPSPCYRIKPPASETPKERSLSLSELRAFWNGLETAEMSQSMVLLLKLLLLTLQRGSEVRGMHSSEFDLKAAVWILPGERSKNKRQHLVPLSPPALGIVTKLIAEADEDGYLFPSSGKEVCITDGAVCRAVSRNLQHFELAKFTPHDLRRTGSTQLGAFKVPRFVRDRLLNHTDPGVGAVYDLYDYHDEKRAALTLWSKIVQRTVSGRAAPDPRKLRSKLAFLDFMPS